MFKHLFRQLAIIGLGLSLIGCATNPITGRSQLITVSPQQEQQMGAAAYQQVKKQSKAATNPAQVQAVKRIGRQIAIAAEKYMVARTGSGTGFHWQFMLIQNPEPNAFVLPGGKVAVYTGILPVAYDDAGLAVVLGHEVAHAMLRHASERMSQDMLVGMGSVLVGTAVEASTGFPAGHAASIYDATSSLGITLPFSRMQETEADYIGMQLTAMAGYNPQQGLNIWRRLQRASKGPEYTSLLSTHPGVNDRIKLIQQNMSMYMRIYNASSKQRNARLP